MSTVTKRPLKEIIADLIRLQSQEEWDQDEAIKLLEELDSSVDTRDKFNSYSDDIKDIFEKFSNDPKFASHRFKQELANTISDGATLYNTIRDIGQSKEQVKEGEDALDALVAPAIPKAQEKNIALQEATEDARRRATGRLPELDPLLQQNMDMLGRGLDAAKIASGGQSGVYGSLAQNAVNKARRDNLAAIPATEQAKRADLTAYHDLIGKGMAEDQVRNAQMRDIYKMANERYLAEAQAAGQLAATGHTNLRDARYNLGGQLGAVAPGAVDLANKAGEMYKNWREQRMERKANQYNALSSVDQDAADYGARIQKNLMYRLDNAHNRSGQAMRMGGTNYTYFK
jgi:hypothetical protein